MILVLLAGLIPGALLFLWLRNRMNGNEDYKKLCDKALLRGALSTFPVVLMSGALYFLMYFIGFEDNYPILYIGIHEFVVIAFSEELMKYFSFKRVLKNTDYPYSWLDTTVLMTIAGTGFGAIESIVYSLTNSVGVMLVRGISFPHSGYGFIVGYFYGKSIKTGNRTYNVIGFMLSWLLHGLYDFSLSSEVEELNDIFVFIAVSLALLDVILVIRLIVFANKAKKDVTYTGPLYPTEDIISE